MFTPGALQRSNRHSGWSFAGADRLVCVLVVLCGAAAWAAAPPLPQVPTNGIVTVPSSNSVALAAQLRDIRGPVEIPSGWVWVWRTLFALALGGLGWLAWWYWRRRQGQSTLQPPVPPSETARDRLREALALIDQPQTFCFAITEILRTYLEQQFGMRAPDRTTEEFLAELQRSAVLDRHHKALLEDFLTRCDLVKFARQEPERPELEQLHQAAMTLVDETAGMLAPSRTGETSMLEEPRTVGGRRPVAEGPELEGEARYMPREAVGTGSAAGEETTR